MFCLLKFYKRCFFKEDLQKHFVSWDGVLWAKEIHRLDPIDLKINSLVRNPRLLLTADKNSTLCQNFLVTSISAPTAIFSPPEVINHRLVASTVWK
jgi:hypothetical protein